MNTCKNCKYWHQITADNNQNWNDESPHLTPHLPDNCWGRCHRTIAYYDADSDIRTACDGILVWDYEQYSACGATGENFGCIHWEKKICENCKYWEEAAHGFGRCDKYGKFIRVDTNGILYVSEKISRARMVKYNTLCSNWEVKK